MVSARSARQLSCDFYSAKLAEVYTQLEAEINKASRIGKVSVSIPFNLAKDAAALIEQRMKADLGFTVTVEPATEKKGPVLNVTWV